MVEEKYKFWLEKTKNDKELHEELLKISDLPEEIDINRAAEAKARAERRLKSADENINMARADLALRKSLIRLQLAEK